MYPFKTESVPIWTFWEVQVYPTHPSTYSFKSASEPHMSSLRIANMLYSSSYIPLQKCKCTLLIFLCNCSKVQLFPFEPPMCPFILLYTLSIVKVHLFEPYMHHLRSASIPFLSSSVPLEKNTHLNLLLTTCCPPMYPFKSASVHIWISYVPLERCKYNLPSSYAPLEKCKSTYLSHCTPWEVQLYTSLSVMYPLRSVTVPISVPYVPLEECKCTHLHMYLLRSTAVLISAPYVPLEKCNCIVFSPLCTPWEVQVYSSHLHILRSAVCSS